MKSRSTQKELMDLGPEYYTEAEYEECLKKLFLVGKYTGLHRDTFNVLEALQPKTVLDVGCGDGALLAAVAKRLPNTLCYGIDISSKAISHAQQYKNKNVDFACQDRLQPADVVMVNLVCHHMADDELGAFLHKAYASAERLVLINDLHRHKMAKALFGVISGPLFSNRLISHDGITSIERGFVRCELDALIGKIAPVSYQIKWRLPFRWQVLLWKR